MPLNTNCYLTDGLNIVGCSKDNQGGVNKVYFANYKELFPSANPTSWLVTYDNTTTGEITEIDPSAVFYTFDVVKETSSMTETMTANVQNGTLAFNPSISLVMNKLTTEKRNLVHMLATGLLVAVVEDNNGAYWMAGFNKGLDVTAVESTTGTALGDRNGITITLTGAERYPMAKLQDDPAPGTSIIAGFLTDNAQY